MGGSTFAGNAPLLKGSTDEVVYSIAAVTPATNKIGIDAQTGALSVAAGTWFQGGSTLRGRCKGCQHVCSGGSDVCRRVCHRSGELHRAGGKSGL